MQSSLGLSWNEQDSTPWILLLDEVFGGAECSTPYTDLMWLMSL